MSAREPVRLPVDSGRMMRRIAHLAQLTEPERPYTRRAFTDLYLVARAWLEDEFRAAGLEPRLDAGANLVGGRAGRRSDLGALALGSHTDTVAGGGRFDGVAGVVTALEVAQVLHEHGVALDHPLRIIDFLSEEPSDYGASCVGSRALVGTLSGAMLAAGNAAGEPLAAAIDRMGGHADALGAPLVQPGEIAAFLELHIEQGPVLEGNDVPIGVVQGIVGIRRLSARVVGRAGHAGTTPMHLRQDALVGAAAVIQDVARRARRWADEEAFVATVGKFDVYPNGSNVIPGEVRFILEARALDDARIERFLDEVVHDARDALEALDLGLDVSHLSTAAAVRCDERIKDAFERAGRGRGHAFEALTSGAGHDAMQVARVAPVGMIFIPCRDGVSHNPAEEAQAAHVAAGAEVLLDAILTLDNSLDVAPG